MQWRAIKARDEATWTEGYLNEVIGSIHRRPLPPAEQKIGGCWVLWNEIDPGVYTVHATGGTVDDRNFVRHIVGSQLKAYGMTPAQFYLGGPELRKTAAWQDIMEKAQRLRGGGQVVVNRNGVNVIHGVVQGDHGVYECEISREDPNTNVITQWQCDCDWDQFAWQRTRKWKKYEGRVCSHVLALYWQASTMPLDEEFDPEAGASIGPSGQLGFGTPETAPTSQPGPRVPRGPRPPAAPDQQLSIPGIIPGMAEATPPMPPGNGVLPPYPGPPMPVPTSVPGAKTPTPDNPMQYPGGTFSSVTAAKGDVFNNSDMVRINEEEMGIAEGKSEAHGAGQYRPIPKNSIGEVLGQDPTTGWVDVIFPIHDSGPMEPYHVRAWIEPEKLSPMPNVRKPGPFIKRRSARDIPNKHDYVYHYAPTTERARIMAHGLQPGKPSLGNWPDPAFEDQPVGVYVFAEEEDAVHTGMTEGSPVDVWRIPRNQIKGTTRDRILRDAFVITNAVKPELHLPWEERDLRDPNEAIDDVLMPTWRDWHENDHGEDPDEALRRHQVGQPVLSGWNL